MKTMDFVDKVDDVINKHNDKVNEDAKKEFLDKLKAFPLGKGFYLCACTYLPIP